MIRGQLDLPVSTLAACLRRENLGDGHPVIAESPVWRDRRAEREHEEAVRGELAGHGLLDDGKLDPDFRESLTVLARPAAEYSCWAKDANGAYRALVGVSGREAVLAIRGGQRLLLRSAHPERPAEELVTELPDWPPARAQAMNVRRADYDALLAPTGSLTGSRDHADAKRLLAILREPRLYAAEFHAATRDRTGVRHRARQVTMIDTEQGRWLISRRPGPTRDEDWVVAVPGSRPDLVDALYRMRAQTR